MRKIAVIFLILCTIGVILFISLFLYVKIRNPECGANLDLSGAVCFPSKEKTDPLQFYDNFITFIQYVQELYTKQNENSNLQKKFQNYKIIPGTFSFAIPELLTILPSDFGQNPITPYGLINFMNNYIPCVSNTREYCNFLLKDLNTPTNLNVELCDLFMKNLKNQSTFSSCPFSIHDKMNNSDSVYIDDVNFFNQLGMLGAFSMNDKQGIVCKIKIPAKDLELFYWSFNVYVSETLDPNNVCYPYKQINFASIVPPFNNYKCSSFTKKSPFENVQGIFILSPSVDITNLIKERLATEKVDFIHDFTLPTKNSSFPIQNNLPNPNKMTQSNPYFNYKTQRLALMMRINNYPSDESNQMIQDYIYQKNQNDFEVFMIDFETNDMITSSKNLYDMTPFPKTILPPVNEYKTVQKQFQNGIKMVNKTCANNYLFMSELSTRFNLVSISAPLYKNILFNTKIPYKGGYQALQMAGNMQGDNHDTQYRSSKAVCLSQENDALIGIFVNHSFIENCFYNSISVTDLNKAFGYKSLTFTLAQDKIPNTQQEIIIALVGRNYSFLNFLEQEMKKACSNGSSCPLIEKIHVETGETNNFKIPDNHQLLLVERCYLNTNFEKNGKVYNYFDYFKVENEKVVPKEGISFENLENITAPSLEYFIPPTFYKISQNQIILSYIIIGFIIFFCFVAFLSVYCLFKK